MLTAKQQTGFTLIELLVVIAIIGLLTSTVLASLGSAKAAARDAGRLTALKQVQNAIEMYYNVNKAYPDSFNEWNSQCSGWGTKANANVIPGLVPQYISSLPIDPDMNVSTNDCCYIYRSDGINYKFLSHSCTKTNYTAKPTMIDPVRNNPSAACISGIGPGPWYSWAVYNTNVSMCW